MHYWAASFLWQIFCRLAPHGGPATGATRSQRSPHAPIDQLVPGASRGGAILVAYDGWDQLFVHGSEPTHELGPKPTVSVGPAISAGKKPVIDRAGALDEV